MRFSRFKSQMEGLPTTTRKPREEKPRQKKKKSADTSSSSASALPEQEEKGVKEEQHPLVKGEPGEEGVEMEGLESLVKNEPGVKIEEGAKVVPVVKQEPMDWSGGESAAGVGGGESVHQTVTEPVPKLITVKDEPIVKMEPRWED